MTVLTWLVVGVRAVAGKIAAIVAAGYVLFAPNLAHTIFAGWRDSGHPLGDLVRWLVLATVGNLVGGVAFVTAFRVVQVNEKRRQRG